MRKAGLVLGVVGGLAAGLLGMTWLSDANTLKDLLNTGRSMGVDMSEIDGIIKAAYLLLVSAVLGFIGGVMAIQGRGKLAAALMLIGAVMPVLFAPKALAFTCILLVGGLLCLMIKSDTSAKAVGASA